MSGFQYTGYLFFDLGPGGLGMERRYIPAQSLVCAVEPDHSGAAFIQINDLLFRRRKGNEVIAALNQGNQLLLLFFGALPLGDVQKRNDGTHDFAVLSHRVGPVLRRKTGSIRPPHELVIDVRSLPLEECLKNAALIHWKRTSIGA